MADRSSEKYHEENSYTVNDITSSQAYNNSTIPKANTDNIIPNRNANLSQNINIDNHSALGTNHQSSNYNPALGQNKMNRNNDLTDKKTKGDDNNNNNNLDSNKDSNEKSKEKANKPSDNSNGSPANQQRASSKDDETGFDPRKSQEEISPNGIPTTKTANQNSNNYTSDSNRQNSKESVDDNNAVSPSNLFNNAVSPSNLFNNLLVNQSQTRKVMIIGGAIITVVLVGYIIFSAILAAMTVILTGAMCDNNSGVAGNYSGSGDVLEFMCGMQSPVKNYTVTSKFGYNVDDVHASRLHAGIDLAVSTGTPVYAAQSGTVVGTDTSSGYGHDVVIDHGGGIFTRYAHNSKLLVSKGDIVGQGQEIAKAGSTGHSTGPHGHFEIMKTTLKDLFSGHQDPNAYFTDNANFMASCGSSAIINTSANYTEDTSSTTIEQKPYDSIKILKKLSKSTGSTKSISRSGRNPQSFAYHDNYYYVQWISQGANGRDGYIYKYDNKISAKSSSPGSQAVGHGNGLTYSTIDNKLYSVTVSGIRDNTKATIIDPNTLRVIGTKKLDHGTSAIAFDRITNRFITSSGASSGNSSSTGYLYVYDSNLSKQVGAKSIAKKRWKTPGDIAAYGGIIYVTISSYGTSGSSNYIDMYNEDTGEYLGSYSAPYSEIEGIDINDNGEIVLLFHSSDFLQFTGIKANVINGTSDSGMTNSQSNECCLTSSNSYSTYSSNSSGEYCPNGITVTGKNAGTYDLDEYVERVVTAENGGANDEALKALAVAARTYAINRTDNCKNSIVNSTAAQVMADKASDKVKNALESVKGSIMLYNGNYFSAEYSSFLGSCSGGTCTSTFIKVPSNEKATFTMPSSYLTINAGHERGLSQNGSNYMASQGKTFDEILKFFYADGIEITGVTTGSSNSCSLGGNGTYKNGKIWDYNQADYSDAYCGGTIADSGCGPTSMAMVVSTLLNERHDPSELAKASNVCSTKQQTYFMEAAEKYGLKAVKTTDHEEVMTALNRGDSLVIANVTNESIEGLNNFWTEGGHYIVLAGHEGRSVWVQDPNKSTTGRGNGQGDGVYDFDKYIKPAAKLGYIIVKKA